MKSEGTKKRKRDGESSGKPKKKVVLDVPVSAASVSSVLRSETCPPVVGKKLEEFCYERKIVCQLTDDEGCSYNSGY